MVVNDQMACTGVHSLYRVEFASVYHYRQFDAAARQMPGLDKGELVSIKGQESLDVSLKVPRQDGQ